MVWNTGTVNGNEVTYYVDIKEHNSETGNYITHVYAYDKVENVAFEAAKVTVPEPILEISDVTISEITSDGYRVTCTVNSNLGIKNVRFATWTEKDGQDDLLWTEETVSGNRVTCYVSTKDHNNETGKYITHIYAYDNEDKYVYVTSSTDIPEQATVVPPDTKPEETVLCGDVNNDGVVSIDDATLILKCAVGIADFNLLNIEAADVDKDGKVNVKDSTLIQKYISEIISEF